MRGRIRRAATLAAVVLAVGVSAGCLSPQGDPLAASRDNMLRDLEVLAGDELEGRGLGQPGLERALDYAASELERAGAEPGYAPGSGPASFLQPVPIIQYTYGQGITARLRTSEGERVLGHGEDMVLLAPGSALTDVPLRMPVFVGYGISEPDRGWDDYAGLDVAGRMVVMLEGTRYPHLPPELQREYADPAQGGARRARAAEEHGAAGVVVVPPAAFFSQWSVLVSMRGSGTAVAARDYSIQAPAESPFPVMALNRPVIEAIFSRSGFDPFGPDGAYGVFPLVGVELGLTQDAIRTSLVSHNAVALVPGSDPELGHEAVVVSAHIDHLGRVDGAIFNGANDDASGAVMVLELARRLAREPPRRSVLLVLFTAEESDHLGSIHFLEQPPRPNTRVVAGVNLEHMGRSADGTLLATASSELLGIAEAVARGRGEGRLRTQALESPEVIGGSDSFSFFLHGIPLVIIGGGTFPEYHGPGDDVGLIDLDLLGDGLLAVEELVRRVAEARDLGIGGREGGEPSAHGPVAGSSSSNRPLLRGYSGGPASFPGLLDPNRHGDRNQPHTMDSTPPT